MALDSLYVRYINLDRRTDRDVDTLKKFIEILGFEKKNIKRFSAIDGTKIIEDLREKNYIDDELIGIIRNLELNVKAPELGCLLSHYLLLKQVQNDDTISDESIVFIFEDDFFIGTQFIESTNFSNIIIQLKNSTIDKENNWDLIYFGGRFNKNFIPSNNDFFEHSFDNFYRRINGTGTYWDRTTHCYLVKKNTISNVMDCYLEYFKTNSNPSFQADSFYNSLSNKIKMYDYFPHIFYSPMNYSTDIQRSNITVNTKDIV